MSLYNIKENGSGYKITKWDEDFNPVGTYTVSTKSCECKGGRRPTCRHRQMLPVFQYLGRVNTGWFLEFEDDRWFFLDPETGRLVTENRVKGWWRRA